MNPLETVAAWADGGQPGSTVQPAGVLLSAEKFDLKAFIARHGLAVRRRGDWRGGEKWELESCPFNPEHTGGCAVIIRGSNGALGFKCHHNSCAGIGWIELRERLEPASRAPRSLALESGCERLKFRIEDLQSIWTLQPKAPEWIVESLVPGSAITLLCGDSGVGKSTFALALAGAVANGEPFLTRATKLRDVLYVDRENPDYIVQERVRSLQIPETERFRVWGLWAQAQPEGPQSREIIRFAGQYKPLIIFDSLVAFHTGSEQDATETRRYFQLFRNLAAEGASVLIVHHTGKAHTAQEYRGSSDIKAAPDVAYLLESLSGREEGIKSLRLRAFKNRLALPETLRIEYRDNRFDLSTERVETHREIIERIVGENAGASKQKIEELAKVAGVAQKRTRDLLDAGVKDKWLTVEVGPRGRQSYRFGEIEVGVL